jgi:hypothetical protein
MAELLQNFEKKVVRMLVSKIADCDRPTNLSSYSFRDYQLLACAYVQLRV